MNNFIAYFYHIKISKFDYNRNYYSFNYNGFLYRLYIINNNINVNALVNINKQLLRNTLVSEIINNKDGNYVSNYNNHDYILIKIYVNINQKISLKEINYLSNMLYSKKNKISWGTLWSNKIDYLEELINENGKKYPLLVDSFNYFVGMAENAISYYNNINISSNYKYVISHKVICPHDTIEALYNPLNIIFDYRARDIAEYIKNAFFVGNQKIFNELKEYMHYAPISITDVELIIARMLYPSFYFEMYEDILVYEQDETIITKFVNRTPQYEKYLGNVIAFFKSYYDVTEIDWLNRKNEV